MNMIKSTFSSFNWRSLLLTIIPTLSLIFFFSIYSHTSITNPFLRSLGVDGLIRSLPPEELPSARVAVCLVGGARRFELTGPSIIKNVLEHYPNSDLFLHSPLDKSAFKLSLLKSAPRIASVRIFEQKPINLTESAARVLHGESAPSGYQGLLQYFNLVEGCLTLIQDYQKAQNITYDWIVRTRVDGYWNAPLDPNTFVPGKYSIPIGSRYLGINDRLGLGDLNTSIVALSRLSLIPEMDSAGLRHLNSESSYEAQFKVRKVSIKEKRFPFCTVSDRRFKYPLDIWETPVFAISSRGPLGGAYCRPCKAACGGKEAEEMVAKMRRDYGWIEAVNGTVELCDGSGPWADGWEEGFDSVAGEKLAAERKRVIGLSIEDCVSDFEEMKRRCRGTWEVPPPENVCGMMEISNSNNTSR